MFNQIHPLKSYLLYWLFKEGRHAVQSPFVFNLYQGLLQFAKESKAKDLDLEVVRKILLADKQILEISDYGAGSKKLKNRLRTTAEITRHSTSGRKFSQLYQYFCGLTPAQNVLELGTCVGINTRYLSRKVIGSLYSFEGSNALFHKAHEIAPPTNTQYIFGKISDTLPPLLNVVKGIDFALIDATHTYDATLNYFKLIIPYLTSSSILAIGDIHWSPEMEKAWLEIKDHPSVKVSLDFYECGILLFKEGIPKMHYILHF